MREIIATKNAPAAIGPYSQAVRVGDLLFLAGQTPLTPDGEFVGGDIKQQTRRVMENLKSVLEAAGASMSDVVKSTCFLTSLEEFQEFNEVYGSYFGEEPPARTTVEVSKLPVNANVEVEMIAHLGRGG